jgi:hypothetical protein
MQVVFANLHEGKKTLNLSHYIPNQILPFVIVVIGVQNQSYIIKNTRATK